MRFGRIECFGCCFSFRFLYIGFTYVITNKKKKTQNTFSHPKERTNKRNKKKMRQHRVEMNAGLQKCMRNLFEDPSVQRSSAMATHFKYAVHHIFIISQDASYAHIVLHCLLRIKIYFVLDGHGVD